MFARPQERAFHDDEEVEEEVYLEMELRLLCMILEKKERERTHLR